MPIHVQKNVYKGINAHLHSYFQQNNGWAGFHGAHLTDLTRKLQSVLPLESGYRIGMEESLQVVQYDLFGREVGLGRMRPDVSVFQQQPEAATSASQVSVAMPDLILPGLQPDDLRDDMLSIVIRRIGAGGETDTLVTRIELLSPANKPPGSHHRDYNEKRRLTLQSGVKLVEIDYLHERRSPVFGVPDYPQGEANAFPYTILVTRPEPAPGETHVYGFHVDDPIPVIAVPLLDDDTVTVDFGAVYQQTYALDPSYSGQYVDYAQEPINMVAYSADDQARIRAVMARAAEST